MTEAEQTAAIDAALLHHRTHCPERLPVTAYLDGNDFCGNNFRCPACLTEVTVTYPKNARRSPKDRYGLTVTWGTIGPPTPQNAPNPTASEGT